ncbi:MAG: LacI family transcriptional regulator [Anaerolineae bacterium]|nr:LacI family transcriptional regulator [Anaerolineae bacterium]
MNEKDAVTQDDVAERAGVSRSVVSYVINNGPRKVSDATRRRVLAAIDDLGYRPNEHAQRLKQGSDAARNSIGIVTGGKGYNLLERPYYNIVLSSLYDHAYQLNQQISFLVYWEALKDPIFFNKHIHEHEISSLIFILPSLILRDQEDEKLLRQAIERVPNIVCLEETLFDLPAVIFDRAEAARSAVSHLIGLGHERIAFVAVHDQRVTGYKQALLEHGLRYDEKLVDFLEPTAPPVQSSYDIVTRLMRSGVSFTAIFTATDEAAIGAMAAVRDHGLTIPQDIAIASIDNIEIASMIRPALTTVDVPKRILARYAIQSLMTQKDFPDQRQVSMLVPIQLIVRESCGANAG